MLGRLPTLFSMNRAEAGAKGHLELKPKYANTWPQRSLHRGRG